MVQLVQGQSSATQQEVQAASSNTKRRIIQFLQNVLRVRVFFHNRFHVDPVVWGSDQMPLHESEGANTKSLSIRGEDVYVKENYAASRKRVTVMTTVSSSASTPPRHVEFVFKGMGTRTTVRIPYGIPISVQWAPKGSYRLDQLLHFVESLPTVASMDKSQMRIFLLIIACM